MKPTEHIQQAERHRDLRNLSPHAEARLAMNLWGDEYAAQNGGVMDFWDALRPARKQQCRELAEAIRTLPPESNYEL